MIQGQRSMPILPAKDFGEMIAFYTDGLGFSLAGVQKDKDGSDKFAIVQMDQVTIGFTASESQRPASEWAAYIYVEDISTFVDQIQGNGVRITRGPEESFYHCNEVEVEDPNGNLLCFAQDMRPGSDGPGL